jgi:dipeptidyl aminopeptidase/acylaminoacyl peptidase
MTRASLAALLVAVIGNGAALADAPTFDAAAAFGARPSVSNIVLSPDGRQVAYHAPTAGQGTVLMTRATTANAVARAAFLADGVHDRLGGCHWITNDRLACAIYAITHLPEPAPVSRLIAVDADGSNLKLLSENYNAYTQGIALGGGQIIDWLPDSGGSLLMARVAVPDEHVGSRIGSTARGLRVDRVDTRTLAATTLETPSEHAFDYLSDGHGTIRIMGLWTVTGGEYASPVTSWLYRRRGHSQWEPLSTFNSATHEGFEPLSVDGDRDVAYGFVWREGRAAIATRSLDGRMDDQIIYANENVDVDELVRLGRWQRVVGVSYVTELRNVVYTDPGVRALAEGLAKALPKAPLIRIVDASLDERRVLVFAGSDVDAGAYYVLDRDAHTLETFLVSRSPLEGVALAHQKPITFKAADGTSIPGYLTLPPGREDAHGLPAIVLPHGGPSHRDEWGFDWLPQYYAARGYAVLQPNFRGSSGYGEGWFRDNGFRSWSVAIGDVLDAGRWLVASGIADPKQLGIVGWSYGGYAALQAAVTDPTLFRAVVAIAPVADLSLLAEQYRERTNFRLVRDFIGEGPHLKAGSPAVNAARSAVPVMLVHGSDDYTVSVEQSRLMDKALKAAGVTHTYLEFAALDHYLDDSSARTRLLSDSDGFLRTAFKPKDSP